MRRREFIAGLGSTATWSMAARAQEGAKAHRVGVLMNGTATEGEFQAYLAAFIQGLRQLGWTQGQNLRLDVRWSAGDARLAQIYAAQLIGLTPDVIVASSTTNLTAIVQATNALPVVFIQVSDPIAQGFVASVKRPGGNITGFSAYEFSIAGKWLDLLKQVAPGLARVAVMFNPDTSPQSKFFMRAVEAARSALALQTIAVPVRTTAEIEPAFVGLLVEGDRFLTLLPASMLHFGARRLKIKALPVSLPLGSQAVKIVTLRGRTVNPVAKLFTEQLRASIQPDLKNHRGFPGQLIKC